METFRGWALNYSIKQANIIARDVSIDSHLFLTNYERVDRKLIVNVDVLSS